VGKQIVCSADSIVANLAEGECRYNLQDNRRFVKIARGCFDETIYRLKRAYKRNFLTTEQSAALKTIINNIIDKLSPKLNTY
jgi:four helix bundle protein